MRGRTTIPCTERPRITTRKYQPSLASSSLMLFICRSCPATRKQTPMGARWMIQVVIFIMTTLTLSKNLSSGFPSSPVMAMATPVTMEKTIKPS